MKDGYKKAVWPSTADSGLILKSNTKEWKISTKIGSGRFGYVYSARDALLSDNQCPKYAVKLVSNGNLFNENVYFNFVLYIIGIEQKGSSFPGKAIYDEKWE